MAPRSFPSLSCLLLSQLRLRLLLPALFLPATPAMAQSPELPDKASYAAFALHQEGDATRGRALWNDAARTTCHLCHSTDGTGDKAGPDLWGIGDKFGREDLIRSILEPSSSIAVCYGTTVLTRKSGPVVAGVIKQATAEWLELTGVDGVPVRVPVEDIATRQELETSLMPEGLQLGLTLDAFSDLVAFLGSLKRPAGASTDIPQARSPLAFEPFLGRSARFDHPVWFGQVPGQPDRYVVLEHFGGSWIVERPAKGEEQRTSLLDLRQVVRRGGPTGLMALTFHPEFAANRKYYLLYQVESAGRISTLVVERSFDATGTTDSGLPPRELLRIPCVTQDHNGGGLTFGPDGFLYIGMGDTGPQRDPQGHGQDRGQLLGKILRIDVDHPADGLPYGIPQSNPFRDQAGIRPEIWAWDFREPWRINFDSATGDLWVGDVGQDQYEEVGIVRAGENHGWNVFEGSHAYSSRYQTAGTVCIPPVFSYSHSTGVSVTGGFVYHGVASPALAGCYVFADFESRRVWALGQTGRKLTHLAEIGLAPSRAVSFGQDAAGELYLVGYDDGIIYHLNAGKLDRSPRPILVLSPTAEQHPVPWRYSLEEPPEGWQRADFDDSGWTLSPAGFGTANTPGGVIRTEWKTQDIWLRREFTLADPIPSRALAWRVHHDEDAEFYINDVAANRLPRWTQGYNLVPVPEAAAQALKPGRNVISIHCHQNSGGQYIDAGLIAYPGSKPCR